MAAKKRKPGFDVPASGQSEAGWVYRSDTDTAQRNDARAPAPQPTDAPPPVAETLGAGTAETVHRYSTEAYARLPVATSAASPEGMEEKDMEGTNDTTGAQAPGKLLVNGVKVLGEVAIVPGASLIVDGQVKSGILHAVGGLLGLAVLGPVLGPLTWLAVGADSYSRSVAGKNLVDQFSKKKLAL